MKNIFKAVNLIMVFFIVFLVFILVAEYYNKKQTYYEEKIYDIDIQYKDKLSNLEKISSVFLSNLASNNLIQKTLDNIDSMDSFEDNKNQLYRLINNDFMYISKLGASELRIYDNKGINLLGFSNQNKNVVSLKYNKTIQELLKVKKPISSYVIDKYNEGFRYIYPIFNNEKFVGSIEIIFNLDNFVKELNINSDAKFSVILKKSEVLGHMDDKIIEDNFKTISFVDEFYVFNNIKYDFSKELSKEIYSIKKFLDGKKAFVIDVDSNITFSSYIFYPIKNIQNEVLGYLVAKRADMEITYIFLSQISKFAIGVLLLLLIMYFYDKSKQQLNTIEQLREAINQTTLVSKTDLRGKITYVNDAFEKLSGYTKEELIGHSHNIVRHPDMTRAEFRDVWNTIQNKKIWHGTIKNKKKDGGYYIVDATIFPIIDTNGNIREYIAIRHDITELEKIKELLKSQLQDKNKTLEENRSYTRQYEEAINNSTAIVKTDLDNNIIYVNQKFSSLSGYYLEDVKDKNIKEISNIEAQDYYEITNNISQGKIVTKILVNLDKKGEKYFVNTVIYPIRDLKNQIIEHIFIMYDITEIINLNNEIENTQKEVVFHMGAIGESRSKETGNHVRRVSEYSKLLGKLAGLSEEEAELLKQASPMHDIGKVGIPDSILHKPGKLDNMEWEVMQTHSKLGFEMLKHSNRPILKAAATVAHEHHEKFDGSGYPNGLSGENIHIYGRITAIADVFDALGSDRCYKKAWELDKILAFFEEQKGKHFDPKLIDLFMDNLDKFMEIRENFKDEY